VLVFVPAGVVITRCPDVPVLGTLTDKLVAVAVDGVTRPVLNFTRSFVEVVSKFVPLIDTDVPGVPMDGVKLEIVGWPAPEVTTVKFEPLVTVPAEVVTLIAPVVAPDGTVTVSTLTDALITVAVVPLNFTVSSEAVGLNAVP
jgi:hypothetical protein